MSKILIIDDDPVITGIYQKQFAARSFQVEIADDGEKGLEAVKRFRPDCVLLDLSMPNVNGVQWLNEVRKDERFKSLPVVVFTSGSVGWQVKAVRNSDVTYVLSKDGTEPKQVVNAVVTSLETGKWKI
ncbi:MAG TPA: response regulator [Nevskiaceae bacterium]|nr:response regulator [Nevskiaceae bacterium]